MQDEQGLSLYRAITRFLYEDSQLPGYSGSNAALQKDAKQRACGVIQRSWAWGNLLAQHFPAAIRLSIHPQPVDSENGHPHDADQRRLADAVARRGGQRERPVRADEA